MVESEYSPDNFKYSKVTIRAIIKKSRSVKVCS